MRRKHQLFDEPDEQPRETSAPSSTWIIKYLVPQHGLVYEYWEGLNRVETEQCLKLGWGLHPKSQIPRRQSQVRKCQERICQHQR